MRKVPSCCPVEGLENWKDWKIGRMELPSSEKEHTQCKYFKDSVLDILRFQYLLDFQVEVVI